MASSGDGMNIVDISTLTAPNLVANYNTPGYAYDIFIEENNAYLADSNGGVIIFDISNINSPTATTLLDEPQDARQVIAETDYIFVADWSKGLYVYEKTDLSSPAYIFESISTTHNICHDSNYLYIASGRGGIKILKYRENNISNNTLEEKYNISNYPNPFNPNTTISFDYFDNKELSLEIYNVLGQKIESSNDFSVNNNHYKFVWNGKNSNNCSVASGIYFVIVKANGQNIKQGKMLLLK